MDISLQLTLGATQDLTQRIEKRAATWDYMDKETLLYGLCKRTEALLTLSRKY